MSIVVVGSVALDTIYINAGARGLLVALRPRVLTELLAAQAVEVAITG